MTVRTGTNTIPRTRNVMRDEIVPVETINYIFSDK